MLFLILNISNKFLKKTFLNIKMTINYLSLYFFLFFLSKLKSNLFNLYNLRFLLNFKVNLDRLIFLNDFISDLLSSFNTSLISFKNLVLLLFSSSFLKFISNLKSNFSFDLLSFFE